MLGRAASKGTLSAIRAASSSAPSSAPSTPRILAQLRWSSFLSDRSSDPSAASAQSPLPSLPPLRHQCSSSPNTRPRALAGTSIRSLSVAPCSLREFRCSSSSSAAAAPLADYPLASPAPSPSASLRKLAAHQAPTPSTTHSSARSPWTSAATLATLSASAAVAAASFTTVAAKQAPLRELPKEVVLYQYEACPFCNKVKAYLDYYNIPYSVVEVNPLGRKELKWSEYKKVPVLVVDGEPMVDSSAIISTLQARLNPPEETASRKRSKKAVEEAEANAEEEATWRKWVDDHLVHLLSPNIYRNPTEALEAFDYIATSGNFGSVERVMTRYFGATTMYFIGKKLKKKHSIQDERQSLYDALNHWVAAVGPRKFLGGEKPNLADLAVFGVLRPIRSMQTGKDMMERTSIGPWYARMEEEVGQTARLS